jgi:hypothetical protein
VCIIPSGDDTLEDVALDILLAETKTEIPAMPPSGPTLHPGATPLPSTYRGPRRMKMAWRPKGKTEDAKAHRRTTAEEDGFGHVNALTLGGILLLVLALAGFATGYAAGYLIIIPALLLVLGLVAIGKGLFGE